MKNVCYPVFYWWRTVKITRSRKKKNHHDFNRRRHFCRFNGLLFFRNKTRVNLFLTRRRQRWSHRSGPPPIGLLPSPSHSLKARSDPNYCSTFSRIFRRDHTLRVRVLVWASLDGKIKIRWSSVEKLFLEDRSGARDVFGNPTPGC